MNLVCIFPVAGNQNKIPIIAEKMIKEISPKLEMLGAKTIQLKFASTDYVYVANNQVLQQPKGEGIIECLKNCNPLPEYVISCDGSGKIPYEHITTLFQELISDQTLYCVMANRGNNKAISEVRYFIERFEIYCLKKYFVHQGDIPDGQCGLWGYKASPFQLNGKKKSISLTAHEYDIELDLLSEVLENSLPYSFIDIELPKSEAIVQTAFSYENNIKKLKFILNKYGDIKKLLPVYLSEFEENNKSNLAINEDVKLYWGNYKLDALKILGGV